MMDLFELHLKSSFLQQCFITVEDNGESNQTKHDSPLGFFVQTRTTFNSI